MKTKPTRSLLKKGRAFFLAVAVCPVSYLCSYAQDGNANGQEPVLHRMVREIRDNS